MGLFDSTSVSETNAPNVGVQTGNAPGVSLNVDTYKSNSDVNITQTDHGAIGSALDTVEDIASDAVFAGESAIKEGGDLGQSAIGSSELNLKRTLSFLGGTLAGVGKLVKTAIQENSDNLRRSLDTADQSVKGIKDVAIEGFDLSQSVLDTTEDIHKENTFFLTDTFEQFQQQTESVVDTIEELEAGRNSQSNKVLDTVAELATVVQTGGESIVAGANKYIGIAAILAIAAVGIAFALRAKS